MLTRRQLRLRTFPAPRRFPAALGFLTHDYVEQLSPGGAS